MGVLENLETVDLKESLEIPPQTTFDIARRLKAIQGLNAAYDNVAAQREEMEQFYAKRLNDITAQKETIMGYIKAYMEASGQRSVPTPAGTAYLATEEKFEWPDDNTLMKFAQDEKIEGGFVVETYPSRMMIKSYIKATGKMPVGLSITKKTALRLRKPGDD